MTVPLNPGWSISKSLNLPTGVLTGAPGIRRRRASRGAPCDHVGALTSDGGARGLVPKLKERAEAVVFRERRAPAADRRWPTVKGPRLTIVRRITSRDLGDGEETYAVFDRTGI